MTMTTTTTMTTTMTDDEIERAPEGSEASRLAAAWWAWHDATSRTYATMAEARAACGAWVRGESDEGPHRRIARAVIPAEEWRSRGDVAAAERDAL